MGGPFRIIESFPIILIFQPTPANLALFDQREGTAPFPPPLILFMPLFMIQL